MLNKRTVAVCFLALAMSPVAIAKSANTMLNPGYATSGVIFSPSSGWTPTGPSWSSDDPPTDNGTSRGSGAIDSSYLVYVDASRATTGTSSITSTFEISYDRNEGTVGSIAIINAYSFLGLVAPTPSFVTSAYVNFLIDGQTSLNNPFDQAHGFQGYDTYYNASATASFNNYNVGSSFTMGDFQLNATVTKNASE